MSGIAGIVRFYGGPVERGQVEGMTRAMAYRGPDGIHHRFGAEWGLGHCMLRTTPESLEESQPLANEDGSLVLVMDGRVDNWEDLRQDLLSEGAALRTRADAELVLRAYERWGDDCVGRMDGDFALALWDARQRRLFCARDRQGMKAFHYHWDGRRFAFATDVNALLALPSVPEEFDEGMVAEFLTSDWTSDDGTFWKDVWRLGVARRSTVTSAGPVIERYWAPDLETELRYRRDEEYAEHYRSILSDLVRRLSRSHRPLACEVSGGLDSSSVFSMVEHLRREGRLLAPGLRGYTLFFGDRSVADEIAYAREVGRHLGLEIDEIPPEYRPVEWYRETSRERRDFPCRPNVVMAFGIYRAAAERRHRVLLSGEGGDHWLGATYDHYWEMLHRLSLRSLLRAARCDARDLGLQRALYLQIRWSIYEGLPPAAKALWRSLRPERSGAARSLVDVALSEPLQRALDARRPSASEIIRGRRPGHAAGLETFLDSYDAIARQVGERNAASHGLEHRAPLIHPQIIQFTFSTSPLLRLRGKHNRYLHRLAMEGLLPDAVRWRSSKANFNPTTWIGLGTQETLARIEREVKMKNWVQDPDLERLITAASSLDRSRGSLRALWNLLTCAAISESVK